MSVRHKQRGGKMGLRINTNIESLNTYPVVDETSVSLRLAKLHKEAADVLCDVADVAIRNGDIPTGQRALQEAEKHLGMAFWIQTNPSSSPYGVGGVLDQNWGDVSGLAITEKLERSLRGLSYSDEGEMAKEFAWTWSPTIVPEEQERADALHQDLCGESDEFVHPVEVTVCPNCDHAFAWQADSALLESALRLRSGEELDRRNRQLAKTEFTESGVQGIINECLHQHINPRNPYACSWGTPRSELIKTQESSPLSEVHHMSLGAESFAPGRREFEGSMRCPICGVRIDWAGEEMSSAESRIRDADFVKLVSLQKVVRGDLFGGAGDQTGTIMIGQPVEKWDFRPNVQMLMDAVTRRMCPDCRKRIIDQMIQERCAIIHVHPAPKFGFAEQTGDRDLFFSGYPS